MRILIIEDEHRIATAIKKGLEQERFAVDVAYTGTDGYDLASCEPYDLILMDIMLPGIDGVSLTKKLRNDDIHVPILMLTAKGEVSDKVAALNDGADDYLSKPFSFEELLARVRALLRRPKIQQGSSFSLGTLSIDTTTFHVVRSGIPIILSQKEFSLLEYMMRNKNKTLTKEQIISHVWDYDSDILPNTLEVFIKNIRKKIDLPFANEKPLIITVRGFGYKMSDI